MSVFLIAFSFIIIFSIGALFTKSIFGTVILNSIFSLCLSVIYVVFNSPDVALTEVAINVFLSSAILFITLKISNQTNGKVNNVYNTNQIYTRYKNNFVKKAVIFVSFASIFYLITFTLLNILQTIETNTILKANDKSSLWYLYINLSVPLTGVKNVVTSTLASFRGFDTMFETFVIFLTSICIYFIFCNKPYNNNDSI